MTTPVSLSASPVPPQRETVSLSTALSPLLASSAGGQTQRPADARRLRIVYQNDSHLAWDNLAHSVTAFDWFSRQGQAEGKDVLRLHGGDYMTGSSERNFSLALQIANRMQLHGAAMGNHELDMGVPTFVKQLQQHANFPTLVSNLVIKPLQQGELWMKSLLQSGQIKTTPQIVRKPTGDYAIIGVTQPAERFKIRPENLAMGVEPTSLEDSIKRVQSQVNDLKKQGVQHIVLLSHMGYEMDQRLATRIDGITAIVGGDTHDEIHGAVPGVNRLKSPSGRDVLVLQAGANADYVGVADLLLGAHGELLNVENRLYPTRQFKKDPVVAKAIDDTLPKNTYVSFLTAPFRREKSTLSPQPFAEFVADSLRQVSNADIALVRRPEIRYALPAGALMSRDVDKALPYDSHILVVETTGRQLTQTLQQNLARAAKLGYGVVYPSGLRFKLDPNQFQAGGLGRGVISQLETLDSQSKQWQPLQPDKTYRVALSDYILANPTIFPGLVQQAPADNNIVSRIPMTLKDIFLMGLIAAGGFQQTFTPPESDGRVTVLPKLKPKPER